MASLDDELEAARRRAMLAILKPDGEYRVRSLCRWYSKTFNTPLEEVEEKIPLDVLFQHFYEVKYEDMEDEDRKLELEDLVLSAEEREIKRKEEESAAMDDRMFLERVKAEAAGKKTDLNIPPVINQTPIADVPVMGSALPSGVSNVSTPLTNIPEDVHMRFSEEEGFEDWDMLGDHSKKK